MMACYHGTGAAQTTAGLYVSAATLPTASYCVVTGTADDTTKT